MLIKKGTNQFIFTTATNLFVRFLGEFEDTISSFEIIWPLHRTKLKRRFHKILWPSHNIWTLAVASALELSSIVWLLWPTLLTGSSIKCSLCQVSYCNTPECSTGTHSPFLDNPVFKMGDIWNFERLWFYVIVKVALIYQLLKLLAPEIPALTKGTI